MEPVKKVLVLLPARDRRDRRRLADFLKGLSLHLQICPRVNLSCFGIHVAEEVADHVERDSALQQVHTLRVPQRVWTHSSVQTRAPALCQDDVFVKDVTDSRTRQSFVARVLEKRLVELFGAIKVVFLHVIAQKLNCVSHQRHSAHFAPLAQKAKLRGWIQTHGSDGKIDQFLNPRSGVVEDAQQNRISSTLWCTEVWLRQDLRQLFFGKVADGWASMFPQRDREDCLTLMHMGRLFRLNISEECVQS